ncbi:hypothetical protein MML48_2g00015674 [Holotrichia oblita]|uniref:Uncharacterized protein n=1 Tax=Holotrichia oblita TaxID=644536 RepID=A0ACB9TMQ6_HOLOL|nr:hypothetical protein MML48_2g00015674 [Holotrichia oblita]
MDSIIRNFQSIAGVEKVIGAVDGTFVPIKAPFIDPEVYRTRKCYYAITLQAVCDAKLKFRDAFAGYPGSVSDIRVFRNSRIYKKNLENPRKYFPDPNMCIIGDKAYPLLDWCIPPYIDRGNLNERKRHFNLKISQTRQVIERAFALLFRRFRRLRYLDMNRADFISSTILACCVLHNICINREANLQAYIDEGAAIINEDEYNNVENPVNFDELIRNGNDKRERFCETLYR